MEPESHLLCPVYAVTPTTSSCPHSEALQGLRAVDLSPHQGCQPSTQATGQRKAQKTNAYVLAISMFPNKEGGKGPSPQGNKAQTLSVTEGFSASSDSEAVTVQTDPLQQTVCPGEKFP